MGFETIVSVWQQALSPRESQICASSLLLYPTLVLTIEDNDPKGSRTTPRFALYTLHTLAR